MMQTADFQLYQDILQKHSGIYLTPEKEYLLTTRITPLCKTLGFETFDDYTRHIRTSPDPESINMIVEVMTTNETSFFRDLKPFQYLKNTIIPHFIKARAAEKRLKIWCAASSTGQEPYSIAMTLNDMAGNMPGWGYDILGTDIADHVIQKSIMGEYNNFEIQRGLPMPTILKYFTQSGDNWTIKPDLKKSVRFKKFNLLDNPARLGKFDIIFCRNVLIYFSPETKLSVLKNLYECLADDGILILGSCENVMSEKSGFVSFENMHGFYAKKPLDL